MKHVNRAFIWPVIIVLSGIILGIMVMVDLQSPVRVVLAFGFLLLCPGMAFVPLFKLQKPILEYALALALSIAINTLVSEVLIVSDVWSSDVSLGIVMGISLLGVMLQLMSLRRHSIEPPAQQPKTQAKGENA